MRAFLHGIAACSCWGAAAFFLRYWRETQDRFFVLFAGGFLVLSVNWTILAIWPPDAETRHFVYLVRLVAFLLMLAAIWDKNRARGTR